MLAFGVTFDLLWRMVVSGVCFGLWPIALKQSGYDGLPPMMITNAVAFTVIVLALYGLHGKSTLVTTGIVLVLSWVSLVFAAEHTNLLPNFTWFGYGWLISAGLLVGCGIVTFLSGIDLASVESPHGMYVPFVVMLIVQTAVPVLFHVFFNGSSLHWINYAALAAVPIVILGLGYKPLAG